MHIHKSPLILTMKIQLLASTTQLGKKLGTPSPHSSKYSSHMYHGTPRLKKPSSTEFQSKESLMLLPRLFVGQGVRGPHWSRKIPLAIAVKSLQRRMALELVHYLNISPLLLTGDASLISKVSV